MTNEVQSCLYPEWFGKLNAKNKHACVCVCVWCVSVRVPICGCVCGCVWVCRFFLILYLIPEKKLKLNIFLLSLVSYSAMHL